MSERTDWVVGKTIQFLFYLGTPGEVSVAFSPVVFKGGAVIPFTEVDVIEDADAPGWYLARLRPDDVGYWAVLVSHALLDAPILFELQAYTTDFYGGTPDGAVIVVVYYHPRPRRMIRSKPLPFYPGKHLRRGPRKLTWVTTTQTYEQAFRVANTALDLYELYVGEDAPPDFDSPPEATSPTLPFSWSPTLPSSGEVTLYLTVRKRNKYNLQSFNVYSTVMVVDALGEVPGPVSAPFDVVAYDTATGYLNVVAKYVKTEDRNPADTWEVYVKFGSDPVPGVDTPAYTADMAFFGVESSVAAPVGPYTPGAVARIVVVAMRADDSERGASAVVLKTLAEAPVDLSEGFLFGGNVYEQEQ